jgi:hypothetical protein
MNAGNIILKSITTLGIFWALFFACNPSKEQAASHQIRLRWVQSYSTQTWTEVEAGIKWSLSYLGASLDTSQYKLLINREDSAHFVLDLDKAGFSEKALNAFQVIIDSLEKSEEYHFQRSIDLARFLVLTEHSSWHYYEITDVAPTLDDFFERHSHANEREFHLQKSAVAHHERKLRIAVGADPLSSSWIAEEGTGSLDQGSFKTEVYEVMDLMPNGQLRFAVYNQKGNLIPGSPHELGEAGKPSKCIWCHEIIVQPLFFDTPAPIHGISIAEFNQLIDSSQQMINRYRSKLPTVLDYSRRKEHTAGEILYISFMEPSLFRLQKEWNLDSTEIKSSLANMKKHIYPEFPFLDSLWYRYYTDSMAPIKTVSGPLSVREYYGKGEPNYFKK